MRYEPIYLSVLRDMAVAETRRHLALVPIPTCRPTETRLAILNDGAGVTGAILWNL